jgi:hypothetical protein
MSCTVSSMVSTPFPVPVELAEDVTDVTDGFNFTPQPFHFSQFQNRAIPKSPDFETGATERGLNLILTFFCFLLATHAPGHPMTTSQKYQYQDYIEHPSQCVLRFQSQSYLSATKLVLFDLETTLQNMLSFGPQIIMCMAIFMLWWILKV